jgi:hypothetical protein
MQPPHPGNGIGTEILGKADLTLCWGARHSSGRAVEKAV